MPTTPTHEVYRVLLNIGGVDSLWTFRIHDDDDSLQIDIESTGDTQTSQEMTTDSVIRDFDQHVDVSYVTTQHVLQKDTPSPGMYTCSFSLDQRADDCKWAAYLRINKVTCILSREFGFQCKLDRKQIRVPKKVAPGVFDDLDDALRNPVAWSVAVEPVRATLYPLSCGLYTLKGALQRKGRFYSPIILHLELLPGGQVAGTGLESGFLDAPRSMPLRGTWSEYSLEIFQMYAALVPLQSMFLLELRGRVTPYAFVCSWIYEVFGSDDEDAEDANLRVTAMRRFWSPETHSFFPDIFKDAVRWCLLSTHRRSERDGLWLPSVLWPQIFQFCDSSWFC